MGRIARANWRDCLGAFFCCLSGWDETGMPSSGVSNAAYNVNPSPVAMSPQHMYQSRMTMNSPTKLKTPSRQWSPFSRSRPTLPDMSVRVENHRRAKFAETCSLVHHLNAVSHQWPDSIPMPVPDTPAPWMISPNGGHYKPYSALSSIRPNQRSASTPPFIVNAPMLRATSVQSISQRSTNDRLR